MATTLIHRLLVQVPAPHLFKRRAKCNLNMRNRTELEKRHILFRTWQEKPIDDNFSGRHIQFLPEIFSRNLKAEKR